MLFQKSPEFSRKSSLRGKILLPFGIVLIFLAVSALLLSFYFISDISSVHLSKDLSHFSAAYTRSFQAWIDRGHSQIQRLTQNPIRARGIRAIKDILQSQTTYDHQRLVWTPDEFPAAWARAADRLNTIEPQLAPNKLYAVTATEPDGSRSVVGISAIRIKTPSGILSGNFGIGLSGFFEMVSKLVLSDTVSTALLLLDDRTDNQVSIIGQTGDLVQTGLLAEPLKQLFFHPRNYGNSQFEDTLRVGSDSYSLSITQTQFHPGLFTVVMVKSTNVWFTKLKLMGTLLGILALISLAILGIYTLIIRKITTSLDILSTVAAQVAHGDLDQHIYLESSDEIGQLSTVFNHMTGSLKEARNSLMAEKNRSEAIIACIPEGIIVTDNENRLILANQKAENMLNFSLDKVQGKFLLEYLNHEDLVSILKGKLSGQVPLTRELVIPAKEGKDKLYELTSSLVKNKNKNIGVITILRDITHDRELDELRDGFLRTVSHELRTPLTSIIGFMDLLGRGAGGEVSDKQKELLQISLTEAESLKTLIEDLLDLSRLSAGQMDLQPADIHVLDMFNGIVASFKPLAQAKGVDFGTDFSDADLIVQADQLKIRRVLLNLVSNAIKFTPEGSVTLSCDERGDEVVFSVSDTGIGLMDDERDVIFDKFRQVDYSSTRKYDGIGLGLSIVRQLIEMHHGKVWVESEYEKGSTFYFSIPKVGKTSLAGEIASS